MIERTITIKGNIILPVLFFLTTLVHHAQSQHDIEGLCPFGISNIGHVCDESGPVITCEENQFRTINGSCNNLEYPSYGQAETQIGRLFPADYGHDGSAMYSDLINPRTISNILHTQDKDYLSYSGLSSLVFTWLQFIDHDITIIPLSEDTAPIPVPEGDQYFDPFSTGSAQIPFFRSRQFTETGTSADNPRQQENLLTSWIDASSVYGSEPQRAQWLRSGTNGKLKVSASAHGDLLPCNTTTGNCNDSIDLLAPVMDGNVDRCGNPVKVFVAGDIRANEQPGLTALHTLFVREHNAICDLLIDKGFNDDEMNYQYARSAVIAQIQAITYEEVLPALGITLPQYTGYKPTVDPSIFHEFASAAYRLGHTMVTRELDFLDDNCVARKVISGCAGDGVFGGASCIQDCGLQELTSPVELRDAFFNPSLIALNGIDELLRGLASQQQQEVDPYVIDDMRNFLFGLPGLGGLDLAAINIQRGRDHGLQDYASVRSMLGLGDISAFKEVNSNPEIASKLEAAFDSVDNIDLWSGLVSEEHLPGKSVGVTLHAILAEQFARLRDGDRFWYKHHPTFENEYIELFDKMRLHEIFERNTAVKELHNVFYYKNCERTYCEAQGTSSSKEWIKKVKLNTLNKNSGNNGGYADYTNISTDLLVEKNYYMTVKSGYRNTKYPEYWSVWIDYNQDGILSNDSERVMAGRAYKKLSKVFSIPPDAMAGKTLMRVAMSNESYPEACGFFNYGEVEDYSVNIIFDEDRSRSVNNVTEIAELAAFESEKTIVFPNPATTQIEFVFNNKKSGSASASLFDLYGRLVKRIDFETRFGENLQELDLGKLVPGSYLLYIDRGADQSTISRAVQVVRH